MHIGLTKKYSSTKHQPTVSILIAARNEQDTLPDCLESLSQLNYPTHLFDILILNDNSTDQTRAIAQSYNQRITNLNVIDIIENKSGLSGKMNALAQGIEQSHGEIILITDADCSVPRDWVSEFVTYFNDNVGLVGGMTILTPIHRKRRLFHDMQKMDWIYLQGIASGTAGIGMPVSVLGNNFAFRRQAYQDVGGFERIGFSLTEDMALLRAIEKETNWNVAYPLDRSNAIHSKTVATSHELIQQRRRWTKGGIETSLWGFTLLIVTFLVHVLTCLSFLVGMWSYTLYVLLIVCIADFSIVLRLLKRFKLYKLIYIFPVFELYYFAYTIVLAFLLPKPSKIVWKGRSYVVK